MSRDVISIEEYRAAKLRGGFVNEKEQIVTMPDHADGDRGCDWVKLPSAEPVNESGSVVAEFPATATEYFDAVATHRTWMDVLDDTNRHSQEARIRNAPHNVTTIRDGVKYEPSFVTKDSGVRHVEPTGGQRDTNEGKGRFDLIAPLPLKRLAQLYQRGAKKYGDRNWEKGIRLSRYLDSAMRHINDYLGGDRSEDHLIAAAWNCFTYVATEAMIHDGFLPDELNDIPVMKDTLGTNPVMVSEDGTPIGQEGA